MRQYRGYQHPTTREEMGLRPGEVQTKIFHPMKFQKPKSDNPMDEEISTFPDDGQPQVIDDLVFDTIDLTIRIQPLAAIMAKTIPSISVRQGRNERAAPTDVSKIDWSMVNDARGKKSYTVKQLKDIIASKAVVTFPTGSKKQDYVDYILNHKNEWSK